MLDDPANGLRIFVRRAEIPWLGDFDAFHIELFGKAEVTGDGLKHMLPRADRSRRAYG